MPIILYTLRAHSASYLTLTLTPVRGYERAHAWRPRIMRVSLDSMSYDSRRCDGDFSHLSRLPTAGVSKIRISLIYKDLQKELCRTLQNFALSRNPQILCGIFAVSKSNE